MTDNKIKIGIIGTGQFAQEFYLPECSKHKSARIWAIANRSPEKANQIANKYGVNPKHIYTGNEGWQALLNNNEIDAVIICTPNYLHAKIAIEAANKGIDVLVEKPMAVNESEAQAMIDSAQDNNTILMVAFPQRFIPAFSKAKEIIDQGILGKINTIHSTFGHSGPEIWSPSGKWYFETSQSSGGVLLDLGSHQIDTLSWLINKRINEVSAFCSTLEKKIEVEDNACINLKFEGGSIGCVMSSWTTKPDPISKLSVYGEYGTIQLEHNCLKLNSTKKNKIYRHLPSVGYSAKTTGIKLLLDNFIQSIQNQEQPLISGKDGLISLQTIIAGYESFNKKSIVELQLNHSSVK